MALAVRDARSREVSVREEVVIDGVQAKKTDADPKVRASIADLKKAQAEFRASVAVLKSLP